MSRGRDESGTLFFVASTEYIQVDFSDFIDAYLAPSVRIFRQSY